MNNSGYSMIQQTQDQWLGSVYHASSREGGISFPDYEYLAKAFNLDYYKIDSPDEYSNVLKVVKSSNACICNVNIPREMRVTPQVKFGRPNEDMEPLLPRDMFHQFMLIEALD